MINETISLDDFNKIVTNKDKYLVGSVENSENNSTICYYRHPNFPDGVVYMEEWESDSYGGDDRIIAQGFAREVQKTVTVFETI